MTTLLTPGQSFIAGRDLRQTPLPSVQLTANALNSIELPLVGPILGIMGEITVNHDNDAVGNTPEEDGLGRIITEVNIRDGGGFSYFAVNDGRLLQYLTQFQAHRTNIWPSTLASVTGGGGARDEVRNFIVDFGLTPASGAPGSIDGFSAILTDSRRLTELVFEIRMGTFADLSTASDLTVNSITLQLTPIVALSDTETAVELLRRGVARPQYRSKNVTGISAGSALGESVTLPTGFIIGKSLIIAVDANNDRGTTDADIVSAIAYEDVRAGQTPWQVNWTNYRRELQTLYLPSSTFADWVNVAFVDWSAIIRGVGINRINRQEGDDVLKFTGAGTGSLRVLHKGWTSY